MIAKTIKQSFLVIAVGVLAICALKPVHAESKAQLLEQYLKGADTAYNFTGSAAIAKNGQIIYAGGFSFADVVQKRKNSPTTRFSIGSITKQFTAAAVLQLQEKGLLSVHNTIARYFPDYPEDIANKVTIRHLLSHTSGIGNYTASASFGTMLRDDPPLETQIAMIASLPMDFEPGTEFRYSNSGYKLLEAIIGQVAGMSWAEYVVDSVLARANMKASGYDLATVDESLRANGYSIRNGQRDVAEQWPAGAAGGAGGLYSTVLDLIKWDDALRHGLVVSDNSLKAMYTPVLGNYGYGFLIDSLGTYERIWHDGMLAGFSSVIARIPSESLCVVVLANDDQAQVHKIAFALTSITLDLPYDMPVLKQALAPDTLLYPHYVGAYELGNGQYRIITADRGRLYSQRTGSTQLELLPESKDKFFFSNDNATTLTFKRDASGAIVSHVIHQLGSETEHNKLPEAEAAKVMPNYKTVQVDPKFYDEYSGDYQLAPEFVMTIRRKGDQIFAQATRQAEFELFPSSETSFFYKVVDAKVEFVRGNDGKIEKLVLFQNGMEMPGLKIK